MMPSATIAATGTRPTRRAAPAPRRVLVTLDVYAEAAARRREEVR